MFQVKVRQKYYMRISAGIVADGDQDRAGKRQGPYKRILPETLRRSEPGTLDTDFLPLLFVRDHTARNNGRRPCADQSRPCSRKNKKPSAPTPEHWKARADSNRNGDQDGTQASEARENPEKR